MNRTEKREKKRIYRQIIPCLPGITQGKTAVIFMATLLLFVFASHGYPGSQMSDSKTLALREKYRKMQEYDIKLEKKGYKNGYVTTMLGSEKNDIFLVGLKDGKDTSRFGQYSGGGLWVSNDKAKSWQKSMTGIKDVKSPAYHLVEDEQRGRFYIATENGAYRSDDKARTWQRFSEGHPYEHRNDCITPTYYKLSLDPNSGDVFSRVPLDGFGIYKTGCETANWIPIGHSLPEDSITIDVAFSPADKSVYILNGNSGAIVIGGFEPTTMGIYKGTPGEKGYEWVKEKIPVESKNDYEVMRSITSDPNTGILYACTSFGLYKKIAGAWTKDLDEIFVYNVSFEKGNQQRAIAFTAERFFIKDKGAWLSIKNTPWNELAMMRCATFFKGGIFIATNEGLFASWDNAKSWEMIKLPGAS